MAKVGITTIKNWFKTNLKPTQSQFWDLFDSFWHKDDKIPIASIEDIDKILLAKADAAVLTNHNISLDAHGNIMISKEDAINKSLSFITDLGSDVKYPSVKSVYDWVVTNVQGIPFLGSVTPTTTPSGTGKATWFATQAGTYTNFGALVVNANSLAVISRDDLGAFSISQTAFTFAANGSVVIGDVDAVNGDTVYKSLLIKGTIDFNIQTNLFNINASDVTLGRYINASGSTSSNVTYNITGYIPVVAGQTYTASDKHNREFYDINKTSILYIAAASGTTTVTAPTGAVYFRSTVGIASWNLFQFEEGLNPTTFEAYKEVYNLSPIGVYESQILKDPFDINSVTKEVNLALPKNQYLLGGYENTIYFKGIIDKEKHNYSIRFLSYYLNYKNLARITNPLTEAVGVEVNAYGDNFDIIDTKNINLLIGQQATDNGLINCVAIGDSYTHYGKYLKKVYDICPNINFDGLRSTDDIPNYPFKYEGRGGWTLQKYFNPVNVGESMSPFMHHATYKYYGQTNFWWSVYNNPTGYPYELFEAKRTEIGFDTLTGIKTSPVLNDLMYFDKDGSNVYKYFDGSIWVDAGLTANDFTFDFSKYRTIWNITQPNIVTVMLGLNDFRGASSTSSVQSIFTTWVTQMDELIASVLADNASAKIAILLPSSVCGSDTNNEGAFNLKYNRMMWEARKLIIAQYDERDGESIYVIDTGSSIDPDYGFLTQDKLPFADYTGTLTRTIDSNTPHPNTDGYKQIGVKLSAFIQKIR